MFELLKIILKLFSKEEIKMDEKPDSWYGKEEASIKELPVLKEHISLEKYFMGRDKTHAAELTPEVSTNATQLLEKVNQLLNEIKWSNECTVSSGWRPPSLNAKVANAAKRSAHMTGKAVDIKDDASQSLGKKILENHALLKKYGLWLEDLASTKGWCHLDIGQRSDRPINVFKP